MLNEVILSAAKNLSISHVPPNQVQT